MTTDPTRPDARTWRAIVRREPQSDGRFVYGVEATGIYCRPTCPAKRPKREGVHVFGSADEAERAGYRACRRCSPNAVTRQQHAIAHIQQLLETVAPSPTLEDLAQAVALTPGHVQRLFKRRTGVTPRQYAAAVKAERLQEALRAGSGVAPAGYDAGYASSHALYRTSGAALGMTPGRYRRGGAGETIRYAFGDTPHGRIVLAATEVGVCALRFGSDEDTAAELREEFPNALLEEDPQRLAPMLHAVRDHLAHLEEHLLLPLDIQATDFQRTVWTALRQIPIGETLSYRRLAQAIGRPTATRAVARACAANPVALVIPCHRIVRASGELSGYRWGTDRKRNLLAKEADARPDGGTTEPGVPSANADGGNRPHP